ncbi:hypothetical protein [Tamlana sp. I1]|nr:hypothetical protein [Tamlana sp. I1]
MKILKITLIAVTLIASFTSCTKQDLHDDDILVDPSAETFYTGGTVNER